MRYRAYGNAGEDITPTRAECDAERAEDSGGWFPTGSTGSALAALLGSANTHTARVDNSQH